MIFPLGFFEGYLPKNIGVYVCMIWFLVLLPLSLFKLSILAVYFCLRDAHLICSKEINRLQDT
jgi:hypothetical protein